MIQAYWFLITRNLKNRFERSVRRLREPRYIMGAALAGFYVWTFFMRRGAVSRTALRHGPGNELMVIIVSVIALLILIGAWALPSNEPAFVFSEAEIQFLFAGPVSRKHLISYKMLRSQLRGVFSAFMFSLFAFRGSIFLGVWASFIAIDIYNTFVSFVRARLRTMGIGWPVRFAAVSAALFGIGVLAVHQFRDHWKLIVDTFEKPRTSGTINAVMDILWSPPLGTILYVPRLFAKAVYAHFTTEALPYIGVLLAFAAVFYFLTLGIDVSFEDASIVASQRALARRARMRSARTGRSGNVMRLPAPFRLRQGGRPEMAIVWKNLIGILRTSGFPFLAIVFPVVLVALASIFGRHHGAAAAIGFVALMTAGIFVFAGPAAARGDMRVDILRLDMLKTFPLSAEALLAAEMMAPLIVISLFELLMLGFAVTMLNVAGSKFDFFTRPEFVVSALVFIVPITAIQLLIQNAAIVLFPAWTVGGDPDASRGFTALGQRLLLFLGNLLTLTLALIPAAVLFLPTFLLAGKFIGGAPGVLVATIPAAAVMVVELVIGHKLLASQFEDIDVANDLDAASA